MWLLQVTLILTHTPALIVYVNSDQKLNSTKLKFPNHLSIPYSLNLTFPKKYRNVNLWILVKTCTEFQKKAENLHLLILMALLNFEIVPIAKRFSGHVRSHMGL